jgi:type IV secretory pathway TrbD component
MAIVGLVLIGRNSRLGKGMILTTARRHPRMRQLYLRRLRPVLLR